MSDDDWAAWWMRPLWAVDSEPFDDPVVPLRLLTNCEHYSPDTGALTRCEITVHKLSEPDIEKLAAWRGKQVSLHDHNRRSFGYYEIEKAEAEADRMTVVLRPKNEPG